MLTYGWLVIGDRDGTTMIFECHRVRRDTFLLGERDALRKAGVDYNDTFLSLCVQDLSETLW